MVEVDVCDSLWRLFSLSVSVFSYLSPLSELGTPWQGQLYLQQLLSQRLSDAHPEQRSPRAVEAVVEEIRLALLSCGYRRYHAQLGARVRGLV